MHYNIESKRHITDRLGVLDDYKEWLSSERSTNATHHCIGLMLYDLEQTVPSISEKISVILKDNPEIARSYSLANKFFLRITTGANLENQEEAVKQFLTDLKYDPGLFKVNANLIIP